MRRILGSFGFVVTLALMILWAGLTVTAYRFGGEALFYFAFPGLICGLLITGGHGGTMLQETVAEIVAVGVNMGIVALACVASFLWIRRGRRGHGSARSGRG